MNPNKLLITFNVCGISGNEDIDHYIKVIHQILNQDYDNYNVVISSCLSSDETRNRLLKEFGNTISYNFIDEVLPVLVTFNSSVLEGIKHYGRSDGYVYLESGIDLEQNNQILKQLYECMNAGPNGIVAAMIDTDNGYREHDLNIQKGKGFFIVPVGKSINGHVLLFSDKIVSYYGRAWVDIFKSHCNESVFTFICAALKTNLVVCTESIIHHIEHMDGPSSGCDIPGWVASGRPTYDHPFVINSILNRICIKECWDVGLGYEEFRNIMMHKQDQFDEQWFCINDKLKEVCKTKLFLQPDEFNYDNINHRYIK